jgi:hypothetical protein
MYTILTFNKNEIKNFNPAIFNELNDDEVIISDIDYPKMSKGDILSFDNICGIFEIKNIRFHLADCEGSIVQDIELGKRDKK